MIDRLASDELLSDAELELLLHAEGAEKEEERLPAAGRGA